MSRAGGHDACGGILSTGAIHSAAADWSRYPVGTRFQIIETGEICEIDDYGSALIGTNTIDLYQDSGRQMRNWGVRMVHIKILVWGSARRSLEILTPRARNYQVRPMIAALRQQTEGPAAQVPSYPVLTAVNENPRDRRRRLYRQHLRRAAHRPGPHGHGV